MNPIDTVNLDICALSTFITVLDEGSVSKQRCALE